MTPRRAFREILAGDACVAPASVYDPLSARAADALGFPLAMLAGSIASAVVLGAPDLVVLTLSELAEQVRRITRVMSLPLLVDADHGFGNALSAGRCVEELEAAGVAALTIEDTLLPRAFGATEDALISLEEATGKLRAAVAARRDPETVVLGRTSGMRTEGTEATARRLTAYAETGVDGLFLVGVQTRAELQSLRAATSLPFVLGTASPALAERAYLAGQGVRIVLQGHMPFQAAVKAMYDTMLALRDGATASDLRGAVASPALLATLMDEPGWQERTHRYLAADGD